MIWGIECFFDDTRKTRYRTTTRIHWLAVLPLHLVLSFSHYQLRHRRRPSRKTRTRISRFSASQRRNRPEVSVTTFGTPQSEPRGGRRLWTRDDRRVINRRAFSSLANTRSALPGRPRRTPTSSTSPTHNRVRRAYVSIWAYRISGRTTRLVVMPTALLMQQSGPQAGPQGQSKTVTITITGACGAHRTRRVLRRRRVSRSPASRRVFFDLNSRHPESERTRGPPRVTLTPLPTPPPPQASTST